MRLYIAVHEDVPPHMVPVLVAHTMLGAHLKLKDNANYNDWLLHSFRKCVVKVNQKEFDKIAAIPHCYLGHENTTMNGVKSCAIPPPVDNEDLPNVLRFARLWAP